MVEEYCAKLIPGCYLEVDYDGGYDPLPGDLIEAEAMTAANLESKKGIPLSVGVVKKEMVTGVGSTEYFDAASLGSSSGFAQIPTSSKDILDLYRG
jgi:hypothetical protein